MLQLITCHNNTFSQVIFITLLKLHDIVHPFKVKNKSVTVILKSRPQRRLQKKVSFFICVSYLGQFQEFLSNLVFNYIALIFDILESILHLRQFL